MAEHEQEKTEQATPKRREDTHKKGQVAKSRELSSVFILGGALIYLYFNSSGLMKQITTMTSGLLSRSGRTELTPESTFSLLADLAFTVLLMLMPLLLTVLTVSILVNLLQTGFIFSSEPIQPQISKIDPLKGMKNLFGRRSWVELAKNCMKIIVVGLVAYISIRSEIHAFLPLMEQGPWQNLQFIGVKAFRILSNVCALMAVLAVMDYLYQRWEHEKNIRMTKQEVKEEFKQTEGDPLIKSRIRKLQREVARKRMMAAVPKADVVITNPIHLAVALRYEASRMAAPVVVAKGAGYVADKIKEKARQYHIPTVENKTVAQVLYKTVEIGDEIPASVYKAVAEILAYVYSTRT